MSSQTAANPDVDLEPQLGNSEVVLQTGRTCLLNVPDTYKHGQLHPLVLSFHGAGYNSEEDQSTNGLSEPSLRIAGKPFLTLYGQGEENHLLETSQGRVWKGAPYANNDMDDIQYVHDMIAKVSATYTIDKSRIYACGFSNGGGFVTLLASHPDAPRGFAALATVCPALFEGTHVSDDSRPWKPIPMLSVHGLKDTEIPFFGRPAGVGWGGLPDVRLWRRQWAEHNRGGKGGYPGELLQPDHVEEVHPGVWGEVWDFSPHGEGAEVRALSVEGMGLGHAWPTVQGVDEPARSSRDGAFKFTEEHMLQFFSRHRLT